MKLIYEISVVSYIMEYEFAERLLQLVLLYPLQELHYIFYNLLIWFLLRSCKFNFIECQKQSEIRILFA